VSQGNWAQSAIAETISIAIFPGMLQYRQLHNIKETKLQTYGSMVKVTHVHDLILTPLK